MLRPHLGTETRWAETWQELGEGVPTLAGFARLCSLSLGGLLPVSDKPLSSEAKTLLFAARNRGMIEIKGSNASFEAPARMLAVHIEETPNHVLIFRRRDNPEITIRFLGGFRDLCYAGLVMHQIYGEFSLTCEGLDVAKTIAESEVRETLALATDLDLGV